MRSFHHTGSAAGLSCMRQRSPEIAGAACLSTYPLARQLQVAGVKPRDQWPKETGEGSSCRGADVLVNGEDSHPPV